jgi:hypothetical protein
VARHRWAVLVLPAMVFSFLLAHAIFAAGGNQASDQPVTGQPHVLALSIPDSPDPGSPAPAHHDPAEPDAASRSQLVSQPHDLLTALDLAPLDAPTGVVPVREPSPVVTIQPSALTLTNQALLCVFRS